MGEVIQLFAPEEMMSGPAMCLSCGHEWVATAPVGAMAAECPECKLERGVFVGLVLASDGGMVWACNCKNTFFQFVRDDGWRCVVCGMRHTEFDD